MSVAKIVKAFELVPYVEGNLRKVYAGANKARFDKLLTALEVCPDQRTKLRNDLLATICELLPSEKPVETTPAVETTQPASTTAPPPVPAPTVREVAWLLVDNQPVAYAGQAIPAGSQVCYVGGTAWEPYVSPTGTTAPPPVDKKQPVAQETTVNINDSLIPVAQSGEGKIPYLISVSYSAKHEKVYAAFGLPVFKSHMRCSVPAEELLETLSDSNVAAIRRLLVDGINRVKPVK